MKDQLNAIFRRGSVTYYNSTFLFPKQIRRDVTKLYAFVRVFDDLVDSVPQKAEEFYEMRRKFELALKGEDVEDVVLSNFVELMGRKKLEKGWVDSFLNSMESDLHKKVYYTLTKL